MSRAPERSYSSMSTVNILITNQHSANVGDDVAGIALINQLTNLFPDSRIDIVYNSSKKTAHLPIEKPNIIHHDLYLSRSDIRHMLVYSLRRLFRQRVDPARLSNVGKYLEVVNQSDIVFFAPAGANIGAYRRWASLFRAFVPVMEGKRLIFALNTIGKSGSVLFDIIARYILRRSIVFVRERRSLDELASMKVYAVQGVDSAFSLPVVTERPLIEGEYIAFIPTELSRWFDAYKKTNIDEYVFDVVLLCIARFSSSHDLRIVLLPHLTDYKGWFEKEYFARIERRLRCEGMRPDNITVYSQISSYKDYDNIVAHAALTISMRYHGVVLSAKNATPFVALAYENKMKEVCLYTEQPDSYLDLMNHEEYDVSAMLDRIYRNRDRIAEVLEAKRKCLSYYARLPAMAVYLDYVYRGKR
jgi:colanic acid/amylovoran biosynthesis protein